MREIKFRAWDKVIKNIVKIISLDYECDVAKITKGKDIVEAKLKELELMQYTGLKDKNGVEIYEGDVVKCYYQEWNKSRETFAIVEFKGGHFSGYCKCGCEGVFTLQTDGDFIIEVIGNIYEATPEQRKEWRL